MRSSEFRLARRTPRDLWCIEVLHHYIYLTRIKRDEANDGIIKGRLVVESPEARNKFNELLQQLGVRGYEYDERDTIGFKTNEGDAILIIKKRQDLLKALEVLEAEYNALEGEDHLEPLMESLRQATEILVIPQEDYQEYEEGNISSSALVDRSITSSRRSRVRNDSDDMEVIRRLGID